MRGKIVFVIPLRSGARIAALLITVLFAVSLQARDLGLTDTTQSPQVKLRSVDMVDVHWTGGFWVQRFNLCREVMIPSVWQTLQLPDNGASYRTFLVAAGLENEKTGATVFSDGDVYKWLESIAHVYAVMKDPKLDQLINQVIGVIAKAQQPDGYLSTPVQIYGKKRWERFGNHELYNMGHLMTAACIHHRATGKDNFLNVARKTADYLYKTFQPRPKELAQFGFNPSNIMGAVEMYRTTLDSRYLELADVFVDMRGSQPGGFDQNQARTALRKETEARGHAVTGPYLWAGAADVYAETGERALREALDRIWKDVVYRKMYVTGAVGALHQGASEHKDLRFF